ncbi:protein rep [uncultured Hyphomicrobium sp.]|jgi:hypothetical protein|uniref:protein rep n=1 Tax=uncultured Hyphomicrobium sp. TaxID=194373 RepID=UPI0025D6430C|nr:protein rep [uncultured Hyphomicrobium sp.]
MLKVRARRKKHNMRVAAAFDLLADRGGKHADEHRKRAAKLRKCADALDIIDVPDDQGGVRTKLRAHYNCNLRECSISQAARRQVLGRYAADVFATAYAANPSLRFIHGTFTVPNVTGGLLSTTITRMNRAFERMVHSDDWKVVLGSLRALEVTYSHERKDFHPHYHCFLVVDGTRYFSKQYDDYKSHADWKKLWERSYRHDGLIVDVRVPKPKRSEDILGETLKQVLKYPWKGATYEIKTADGTIADPDVIETLHLALRNRRLYAFTGILRDAAQALKAKHDVDAVDPPLPGDGDVMETWDDNPADIYPAPDPNAEVILAVTPVRYQPPTAGQPADYVFDERTLSTNKDPENDQTPR